MDRFGELRVQVDTRRHLEVELSGGLARRATDVAVPAADGGSVVLMRIRGGSITSRARAPLTGGRSGVLSVGSAARTRLVRRDGEVLERVPVELPTAG